MTILTLESKLGYLNHLKLSQLWYYLVLESNFGMFVNLDVVEMFLISQFWNPNFRYLARILDSLSPDLLNNIIWHRSDFQTTLKTILEQNDLNFDQNCMTWLTFLAVFDWAKTFVDWYVSSNKCLLKNLRALVKIYLNNMSSWKKSPNLSKSSWKKSPNLFKCNHIYWRKTKRHKSINNRENIDAR